MTRFSLTMVFVVAFAASLLSTVPLSVALAWSHAQAVGLSARAVSGSIWSGRLEEMRLRGVLFGNVQADLDPLAMLTGVSRLRLQSERGRATIVEGRVQGLDRTDATIDFAELGLALPVQGAVRLEDATLLFEDGRCSKAQGRISTDVFRRNWNGPELLGELGCDGSAAVARLAGRNADVEVSMALRIEASGRYRLESHVASSNLALRGALSLAGFAESGSGLARSDEGMLGT